MRMTSRRKRPRDFSQAAKLVIDIASVQVDDRPPTPEEQGKNRVLASAGRRGGTRRAEILSPQQRQEIARKGAKAKWVSKKGTSVAREKKEHQ
jgi:hypothetical protein